MSHNPDRRKWLKTGAALTAGMALAPAAFGKAEKRAGKIKDYSQLRLQPSGLTRAENIDLPKMKARLLANENPFGPSKSAKQALKDAIDNSFRYGFGEKKQFVEMIAEKEGVTPDHILLGAGSTELLNAASWYYSHMGKGKLLSGELTYESLIRTAEEHGCGCERVPLTSDYKLNLQAMASRVSSDIGMVYLCNPNNPTGTVVDPDQLMQFCKDVAPEKPVFIDEAYIDYTDDPEKHSMIKCVRMGYDVIVARTFSKLHAFAGLRIGYLVALPATVNKISAFASGGGTISTPSVAAAMASYQDTDFHRYSFEKNLESKEFVHKTLKANGFSYIPSETNFVFFQLKMRAEDFQREMMKKGVGVRKWEYQRKQFCRVSMGTLDEMKMFAEAFKEVTS